MPNLLLTFSRTAIVLGVIALMDITMGLHEDVAIEEVLCSAAFFCSAAVIQLLNRLAKIISGEVRIFLVQAVPLGSRLSEGEISRHLAMFQAERIARAKATEIPSDDPEAVRRVTRALALPANALDCGKEIETP